MGAPPQHSRHSTRSAAGLAACSALAVCGAAAALRRSRTAIRPATCQTYSAEYWCRAAHTSTSSDLSIWRTTSGRQRQVTTQYDTWRCSYLLLMSVAGGAIPWMLSVLGLGVPLQNFLFFGI